MTTRIISLEAENVKKLKAVKINVGDGLTVIGGRNGQGKTTVLDCLEMALSGKKSLPPRPIREGQTTARIVVELDDLIVTRKFTEKDSYLEVTTKEGAKYPKAQAVLDDLYNQLSFDPLAFVRLPENKQAAVLEEAAGIEAEQFDAKRAAIFDERTGVNRDAKTQQAALNAMPPMHKDAPTETVSIGKLTSEADQARRIVEDAARTDTQLKSVDRDIERVTAELRGLQEERTRIAASMPFPAAVEKAQAALAEIRTQIDTAEQTNQKVRENEARKAAEARLDAAQRQADDLTAQIDAIDQERAKALAEAALPIDGLSITPERQVLWNGVPFAQASGAEQIRVSAAIGLAMNPQLKLLLIRDGSLLDTDSMAVLSEFATAQGAQILIERVGTGDPSAIVIEDGEIVAPALVPA